MASVDYSIYRQDKTATEQFTSPSKPKQPQTDNTALSYAEYQLQADLNEQISNSNAIAGMATSLGVELGGGLLGTHVLHKAKNIDRVKKALNAARAAKAVSVAGVVAPEGVSTVAGIAGFAVSEMAIWGISNFAGQSIRQAYGIQDHYSAGEGLAASLFGAGIVTVKATQAGQKIFKLNDGLGKMGAFKNMRTVGANFASGAAIGIAESTVRQTVQIMLNERESYDKYDYVLSGLIGGAANTVIGALTQSGANGEEFLREANERSIASLKRQKAELLKKGKTRKAERLQESIDVITDFQNKLDAQKTDADKLVEKSEFNQEDPRGAPEVKDEPIDPELEALKERARLQDEEFAKLEAQGRGEDPEIEGWKKDLERDKEALKDKEEPSWEELKERARLQDEEFASLEDKIDGQNKEVENLQDDIIASKDEEIENLFAKLDEQVEELKDIRQKLEGETEEAYNERLSNEAKEKIADEDDDVDLSFFDDLLEENKGSFKALRDEIEARGETEESFNNRTQEEPTVEPEVKTVSPRRAKIEALRDKFNNLTEAGHSPQEIVETVLPDFNRQAVPIRDELHAEFNRKYKSIMRNLRKTGEPIQSELDDLLKTMDDMQAFNEVRLSLETGAGRSLLGFKGGADTYAFTGLSERAIREQELVMRLQDNMERLKQRRVLDPDLQKVKDDFDNVKSDAVTDFKERGETFKPEEKYLKKTYKEIQKLAKEKGIKANQKKDVLIKELAERDEVAREDASIVSKVQKKIKDLEQELNLERTKVSALFGTPLNEKQKSAFQQKLEEALAKNTTIQDLKTRKRYYQEIEKQAKLEDELKLELAERSKLEAEGSVGQLKDDVAKQKRKTELSDTPDSIKELRQKIADSKKRVRDKIADLEKAEFDLRYADMLRDLESWHYRALDTEAGFEHAKLLRGVREARRMALIDQLPSVLAGVPTGLGRLLVKDVIRPLIEFIPDKNKYGLSKATQIFAANYEGTFQSLLNWDGTGIAFGRSFKEAELVTTHAKNRFDDRVDTDQPLRTLKNLNAQKVRKYAEDKRKAITRFADRAFNVDNLQDGFWSVLSLGVRGIGSVDEVFRRQVIRGRIHANAKKRAIIAHPNDKAAQDKHFREEMKRTWVRDDGLEVLDDYKNHQNVLNSMNRDLFFAAQGDHLDDDMFHRDMAEKMISGIKKVHNGDDMLGFFTDMFLPYVSVPIRGAYLGGKLAVSPLMGLKGAFRNPYQPKIKKRKGELVGLNGNLKRLESELAKETSEGGQRVLKKDIARTKDAIRQKNEELNILDDRATHYKYESYVDSATGLSLAFLGYGMGANGMATGALNFMTRDQQEKNKLRPFHGMGADYVAAAPWALPFALGADMGLYNSIVAQEERSGISILKEGTTRLDAIVATVNRVTEEVPLFEGIETLMTIVKSGPEARVRQFSKLAQSYFPLPAFVRKVAKAVNDDTTIADLRGGTFMQRQAYYFLGVKPVNLKMDYFGFPEQKPTERLQYLIMRQLPKATYEFNNEFERILAGDIYDDIEAKPESFYGVKLHNFINDDGVTLNTAFNRELRDFKFKYKNGKKVTLQKAIEMKIASPKWQRMYKSKDVVKYDEITGKYKNQALREINSIIKAYHRELAKKLFEDSKFTRQFINKNDKRLDELLLSREEQLTTQGGVIQPLKELLNFK